MSKMLYKSAMSTFIYIRFWEVIPSLNTVGKERGREGVPPPIPLSDYAAHLYLFI